MRLRRIAIGTLAGLVSVAVLVAVAAAQEPPRPDQLVDALNGVFGKHAGDRAAHTKGSCIAGPTDDPVFAARSPAYTVSLIRPLTPQ